MRGRKRGNNIIITWAALYKVLYGRVCDFKKKSAHLGGRGMRRGQVWEGHG